MNENQTPDTATTAPDNLTISTPGSITIGTPANGMPEGWGMNDHIHGRPLFVSHPGVEYRIGIEALAAETADLAKLEAPAAPTAPALEESVPDLTTVCALALHADVQIVRFDGHRIPGLVDTVAGGEEDIARAVGTVKVPGDNGVETLGLEFGDYVIVRGAAPASILRADQFEQLFALTELSDLDLQQLKGDVSKSFTDEGDDGEDPEKCCDAQDSDKCEDTEDNGVNVTVYRTSGLPVVYVNHSILPGVQAATVSDGPSGALVHLTILPNFVSVGDNRTADERRQAGHACVSGPRVLDDLIRNLTNR